MVMEFASKSYLAVILGGGEPAKGKICGGEGEGCREFGASHPGSIVKDLQKPGTSGGKHRGKGGG